MRARVVGINTGNLHVLLVSGFVEKGDKVSYGTAYFAVLGTSAIAVKKRKPGEFIFGVAERLDSPEGCLAVEDDGC